jgi:hypothetical protein
LEFGDSGIAGRIGLALKIENLLDVDRRNDATGEIDERKFGYG